MKRKQRRFTSEAQIIEAIDAKKAELQELREMDIGAMDSTEFDKINARCRRIEDTTLPKLKQALAAFRTELLPITDDKGVVL